MTRNEQTDSAVGLLVQPDLTELSAPVHTHYLLKPDTHASMSESHLRGSRLNPNICKTGLRKLSGHVLLGRI